MSITEETVRHIAKLAAIELTGDDVVVAREKLGAMLDYMEILNKVDTKNVEPTLHIHDIENVLSEDIILESLSAAQIETMSPQFRDGYFKVPRMVNN